MILIFTKTRVYDDSKDMDNIYDFSTAGNRPPYIQVCTSGHSSKFRTILLHNFRYNTGQWIAGI